MAWTEAKLIAEAILDGFDRHYRLFREITAGAQRASRTPTGRRCSPRPTSASTSTTGGSARPSPYCGANFDCATADDRLWRRVKVEYLRLLPQHHQPELAETYYNSVFCRLFDRRYYNNANIFVWPALSTEHLEAEIPTYRCYYPARDGFARGRCAILDSFDFRVPFRDRRRDLRNLLRAIRHAFPRAALPPPELPARGAELPLLPQQGGLPHRQGDQRGRPDPLRHTGAATTSGRVSTATPC